MAIYSPHNLQSAVWSQELITVCPQYFLLMIVHLWSQSGLERLSGFLALEGIEESEIPVAQFVRHVCLPYVNF
jgi:hypothetical protein